MTRPRHFAAVLVGVVALVLAGGAALAEACHSTVSAATSCVNGQRIVWWSISNDAGHRASDPRFPEHVHYQTTLGLHGHLVLLGDSGIGYSEVAPSSFRGTATLTVRGVWPLQHHHTQTLTVSTTVTSGCTTTTPPKRHHRPVRRHHAASKPTPRLPAQVDLSAAQIAVGAVDSGG